MLLEPWSYGRAGLVGFIAGTLLFVAASFALEMHSYYDQLWLLAASSAGGALIAWVTTFLQNCAFERAWERERENRRILGRQDESRPSPQ